MRTTRLFFPATLALVALVAILQAATSSWGRTLLDGAHLSAPREAYTELEFPDHTALPRVADPSARLRLTVELTNHEATPQQYTVMRQISPSTGAPGPTVPIRNVSLAVGQTSRMVVTAVMPQQDGRYAVNVLLDGRPEALRAWIEVRGMKGVQ
jgi:hypothetical protein